MTTVAFPEFAGVRCLMMPYVQGDPSSVPDEYAAYADIVSSLFFRHGDIGFLTIDESFVEAGMPHRGARAKHGRALHTEAGIWRGSAGWGGVTPGWGSPSMPSVGWGSPSPGWGSPSRSPRPGWGSPGGVWGSSGHRVTLDRDVRILLASSLDDSCAVWDAEHEDTSEDGDIGDKADVYPYSDAAVLKAGEVREIGIFTPHESLPVKRSTNRQFIRVVSAGVHGREDYFTRNPLVASR